MASRAVALLLLLLGAGLALGLSDYRLRLVFLRDRLDTLLDHPPTPRSILWVEQLRPAARIMDGLERPLLALFIALLLLAFWALARVLNPSFNLLRPPGEGGPGVRAHVDIPKVWLGALAALLSLWLMGFFLPLVMVVGPGNRLLPVLVLTLGGLPVWTAGLGQEVGWLTQCVLLGAALWWLWGPNGLLDRDGETPLPLTLAFGMLAGLALLPGWMALRIGRFWLQQLTESRTLIDEERWQLLLLLSLVLPVVAMLYTGGCAVLFRPRRGASSVRLALIGAVLLQAVGWGGYRWTSAVAQRYDLNETNLARRLGLEASPFRRLGVIPVGQGQFRYTVTEDGSRGGPGDRIACNGDTVRAVEDFLRQRSFRSRLAFRAFEHLHACACIDWLDQRQLALCMQMLEVDPSPVASDWLLRKLESCPITPVSRSVLDAVADPQRFLWPDPDGYRRLGLLYRRFGDISRAREYFSRARMPAAELQRELGGIQPLADGVVSGTITVGGSPQAAVRVGLVHVRHLREVQGISTAHSWGYVLTSSNTDAAGRYRFTNIPEGEYALVVTGGGIGGPSGQPYLEPHPGTVTLDRFRPRVVVPTMDIRFRQGRFNPDMPSGGTFARRLPAFPAG